MALKQVTPTRVTVGDMDFYIRPFAAFKAANITGELAGVLAPVLGVLAPLVSDLLFRCLVHSVWVINPPALIPFCLR